MYQILVRLWYRVQGIYLHLNDLQHSAPDSPQLKPAPGFGPGDVYYQPGIYVEPGSLTAGTIKYLVSSIMRICAMASHRKAIKSNTHLIYQRGAHHHGLPHPACCGRLLQGSRARRLDSLKNRMKTNTFMKSGTRHGQANLFMGGGDSILSPPSYYYRHARNILYFFFSIGILSGYFFCLVVTTE